MQDFEDNIRMAEKRAEMLRYVQEIRRMREELDNQTNRGQSQGSSRSRDNIVKEWVENLPQETVTNSPKKSVEPRMAVPPVERGPSSETDDLSLGAEAFCLRNAQNMRSQPNASLNRTSLKRRQAWVRSRSFNKESFNSDMSAHTTMSQPSSIEQLLAGRRSDPEELLARLGFCTDSTIAGLAARIPPRFLQSQSAAQGINVNRYLGDETDDLSRPNSPAEQPSTDDTHPAESRTLPSLPVRFRQSSLANDEMRQCFARFADHQRSLAYQRSPYRRSILNPENQWELAKRGHYDGFSSVFRGEVIRTMGEFCHKKFPKQAHRRTSLGRVLPVEPRVRKLRREDTVSVLPVCALSKSHTDVPSRFFRVLNQDYDFTSPRKIKLEKQRQTKEKASNLVKLGHLLDQRDSIDFSTLTTLEEREFLGNFEQLQSLQSAKFKEVTLEHIQSNLTVSPLSFRRPSAFSPGVDFRRRASSTTVTNPGEVILTSLPRQSASVVVTSSNVLTSDNVTSSNVTSDNVVTSSNVTSDNVVVTSANFVTSPRVLESGVLKTADENMNVLESEAISAIDKTNSYIENESRYYGDAGRRRRMEHVIVGPDKNYRLPSLPTADECVNSGIMVRVPSNPGVGSSCCLKGDSGTPGKLDSSSYRSLGDQRPRQSHIWRTESDNTLTLKLVEFTVVQFMEDVLYMTEKQLEIHRLSCRENRKAEMFKRHKISGVEEVVIDSVQLTEPGGDYGCDLDLWDVACQVNLGPDTLESLIAMGLQKNQDPDEDLRRTEALL